MYAKQNFSPPRSRGLAVFCQLLGFVLLFVPSQLPADSLEDAAHKLALKVCLDPHKSSFRIQWQEALDASGYLTEAGKKAFLDQLSACGISLTENADAPALKVAISVTATNALLTADSTNVDGSRQIRMVEIPRNLSFSPRDTVSAPHLTNELIWEQEKPIYSAIEWIDPSTQERFLFLLGDGLSVLRRIENGSWEMMDSTELPGDNGRFRDREGTFFYTPEEKLGLLAHGNLCELSADARISLACRVSHSSPKAPALSSNCEDSKRNLVTGNGDYTQLDRIILTRPAEAGEDVVPDEKYAASVEMPGPVLDISVTQNRKAAFASVRNLSTGNYEVYRITAVCSN